MDSLLIYLRRIVGAARPTVGVAVVLTAWLAATLWASPAAAQFISPGELSKVHADLEGVGSCLECHDAGNEISGKQCLSCHKELNTRIQARSGYHGRMVQAERRCGSCHTEHLGRSRKIIDWGPGKKLFDHSKTAWPLRGKHRRVDCQGCHTKRRVVAADARKLMEKWPKKETYLGLPTQCKDCHFDEHRGQVGLKCQVCHDESRWKPPAEFDHDESDYPLTGGHKRAKCAGCHPANVDRGTQKDVFPAPVSMRYMRFLDIPHDRCVDCHNDVHKGKYGRKCESCHNTQSWKKMNAGAKDSGFHDKHAYPLRGSHVTVPCRSCHGPKPNQAAVFKGLKFKKCTDCHYDSHLGQMVGAVTASAGGATSGKTKKDSGGSEKGAAKEANGKGPVMCESCHTVKAFDRPLFEAEDHSRTRYPLEGGHMAVPCDMCHEQDPKLAARIPKAVQKEVQAMKRPELWNFARFDMPKIGETCTDCHTDVHAGQFKGKKCEDCHVETSWIDLPNFDHDKETDYPHVGKHKTTPCNGCHFAEGNKGVVRYKPTPKDCMSCHFDIHFGQFAKPADAPIARRKNECTDCHTPDGFKALVNFDHNDPKQARFPLEGRHAEVECATCHQTIEVANGITTAIYKPLPIACETCHDDHHKGTLEGVKRKVEEE